MNAKEENAEALIRAASVIRERGWIQGRMASEEGVCARGAICLARQVLVNRNVSGAERALFGYLVASGEVEDVFGVSPLSAIAEWNDVVGRTDEDVIAALEKAAAWTREQV